MTLKRKLDITKYTGYFHDGTLINIDHQGSTISLALESSWINPETFSNKRLLSKSNTLVGELTLKNIKSIVVDDKAHLKTLIKPFDDGEILDLEIYPDKVMLLVEWKNFSPKSGEPNVSQIKIEAENIYWENTPTLNND